MFKLSWVQNADIAQCNLHPHLCWGLPADTDCVLGRRHKKHNLHFAPVRLVFSHSPASDSETIASLQFAERRLVANPVSSRFCATVHFYLWVMCGFLCMQIYCIHYFALSRSFCRRNLSAWFSQICDNVTLSPVVRNHTALMKIGHSILKWLRGQVAGSIAYGLFLLMLPVWRRRRWGYLTMAEL